MSRVDDALRRAAGGPARDVLPTLETVQPLPSVPDASVLDRYACGAATSRRRAIRDAGVQKEAPQGNDPAPRIILQGRFAGKVVLDDGVPSVFVEQYRRLAGTLHELQHDRGLQALMVTSALPREGKTLTAINLGLTLSESYQRRVLLVDADLRRPSLHEAFGLRNDRGLCHVLGSDTTELPLHHVSPFLSVLLAGGHLANPVASLSSDRMRTFLQEARSAFDWILLDTPPIGIMPDAALLAGYTDATLFVIGAGSSPYTLVARAMDELGRDRIVGVVLNRLEHQSIPATDYYHEYGGKVSVSAARAS
jgi:capsular exopolysaccharide synthesis family protein